MGVVPAILLIFIMRCTADIGYCPSDYDCEEGVCFTDSTSCGNTCNGCDLDHVCDDRINIHCHTSCNENPGGAATVVCCNCYADTDGWIWAWSAIFIFVLFAFTAASMFYSKTKIGSPVGVSVGICAGLLFATYSYATSQLGWAAYSVVAWFGHIGYFYGSVPIGIVLALSLSIAATCSSTIKSNFIQSVTPKDFNLCFAFIMGTGACSLFGTELTIAIIMALQLHKLYQNNVMSSIGFLNITWLALTMVVETMALTAWGCYVSYFNVAETLAQGNEIKIVKTIKAQELVTNTEIQDVQEIPDERDSLI